ncbi:MAG: ferrous iron transport protein A [Thermoplasmata archaeon]|nr:ferrous iron transport protein A [Thermoplasmata archaeon]RLF55932.1 MAG: ferrous iron transport protein A [Thermoplasmata archaeon]RLF75583.1 MAG: ferrous iron transport protein A [Thermoplasmata archaeon]HDG96959.1 ferrous iron transport protein A [Desulfobacterales bacterium]
MRKKLSEMDYGEEGVVKSIEGYLRNKVAGMGIRVGKKLKMATKQPIKGPVVVTVDQYTISLGLGIADKIIVEVEE